MCISRKIIVKVTTNLPTIHYVLRNIRRYPNLRHSGVVATANLNVQLSRNFKLSLTYNRGFYNIQELP